ncbi:MAG: DEAD/DEAH box helicase [Cyanobacteria bacterium P01_B01_bin.77]
MESLFPQGYWRPPQWSALQSGWLEPGHGILEASTASGKSLLAMMRMAQVVAQGGSVIYVSPLKALADEKRVELTTFFHLVFKGQRPRPKVVLTTGDVTLDKSQFTDPPARAQVTLTTPERLDAILRNPDTANWLALQKLVVVDEVHLLDDARRGPVLEALLTRLKLLPQPPELRLLSATIGNAQDLAEWLDAKIFPETVSLRQWRKPALHLGLIEAESDTQIMDWVQQLLLDDEQASLLIFRYRIASVNKLMRTLEKRGIPVEAWHSKVSRADKLRIRQALENKELRVVVATSALAMGVNLPTTHVLIVDLKKGYTDLSGRELLQMLGRAGRGQHPGYGLLCVKPDQKPRWERTLRTLQVSPIEPKLGEGDNLEAQVLAELTRRNTEVSLKELDAFFGATWRGQEDPPLLQPAISNLCTWFLSERTPDGRYQARPLGKWIAQSYVPPAHGAGMAKLLRDLIRLANKEWENPEAGNTLLASLSPLDYLLMVLGYQDNRIPYKNSYDKFLGQYHLALKPEQRSQLFTRFFLNEQRPDKVLNSLMITTKKPERLLKEMLWNGLMLIDYAQGLPLSSEASGVANISQRYGLDDEAQVVLQEKVISQVLWYLNALVGITDPKRAYRMGKLSYRVQEVVQNLSLQLTYHSPLGILTRLKYVGKATISKLEQAGYKDVLKVKSISQSELLALGIKGKTLNSLLNWQIK